MKSSRFQTLRLPLVFLLVFVNLASSRKGSKVIEELLSPLAPQVRSCKSLSTGAGRCGRLSQAAVCGVCRPVALQMAGGRALR